MQKICAVYQIKNILNNKIYIGGTADLRSRWKQHRRTLTKNNHHNLNLQNDWNECGEDCFEFSIIEECNVNNIREREQYFLDLYKPYDPEKGYNIFLSSDGSKPNIEIILKLREKAKGRRHSEDTKLYLREINEGENNAFYGRRHTDETKKILSKKTTEYYKDNKGTNTKLTELEVLEIRKLIKEGMLSLSEIGRRFKVQVGAIWKIKNNITWRNLIQKEGDNN